MRRFAYHGKVELASPFAEPFERQFPKRVQAATEVSDEALTWHRVVDATRVDFEPTLGCVIARGFRHFHS
jgi:hypothetical protein